MVLARPGALVIMTGVSSMLKASESVTGWMWWSYDGVLVAVEGLWD